jgi:hypothetical protein
VLTLPAKPALCLLIPRNGLGLPGDSSFAADPSTVQSGGGHTDMVSWLIEAAARSLLRRRPSTRRIFRGGMTSAAILFAENYVEPDALLRDAFTVSLVLAPRRVDSP